MQRITLFLFLLLAYQVVSEAQTQPLLKDRYVYLTTPYNLRPLNVYRGQLQANASYKFAVLSRQFDSQGKLDILKDLGIASVYHYYELELKYGVTNFLEISAFSTYLKRGIRTQSVKYVTSTESISVNSLEEEKGFGDILLTASIRSPLNYKWFDIALRGGIYIQSAPYKPDKPDHAVSDVLTANEFTVNYHYKNNIGYGVPVLLLSGQLKITLKKISLESSITLKDPLSEGENIRWDQNLTDARTFIYTSKPYTYLPDRALEINTSLHYQAAGWFSIYLNLGYFKSTRGWTEYWGRKYSNPEKSIVLLEPGFEIQISPSVRILQTAGFPLKGENNYAPFYLNMALSYNLFPFSK